jgi:hypothetical protein
MLSSPRATSAKVGAGWSCMAVNLQMEDGESFKRNSEYDLSSVECRGSHAESRDRIDLMPNQIPTQLRSGMKLKWRSPS